MKITYVVNDDDSARILIDGEPIGLSLPSVIEAQAVCAWLDDLGGASLLVLLGESKAEKRVKELENCLSILRALLLKQAGNWKMQVAGPARYMLNQIKAVLQ